jgi:hypothetical protein
MQPDPARAVRCFDVRWENGRKPVHKQGIVRQRHFCPFDPVFYWVYALAVSWTFVVVRSTPPSAAWLHCRRKKGHRIHKRLGGWLRKTW